MRWRKLVIASLGVLAALLTVAATPSPSPTATATPAPSPTSVVDPTCAFTNGCVSPPPGPASPAALPDPTPGTGVQGVATGSVATPNTGGAGILWALAALPLVALGFAAMRWARRTL